MREIQGESSDASANRRVDFVDSVDDLRRDGSSELACKHGATVCLFDTG